MRDTLLPVLIELDRIGCEPVLIGDTVYYHDIGSLLRVPGLWDRVQAAEPAMRRHLLRRPRSAAIRRCEGVAP